MLVYQNESKNDTHKRTEKWEKKKEMLPVLLLSWMQVY